MTKPLVGGVPKGAAPKPQLRSADYSLRYQVMLDTLNTQRQQQPARKPGVTPLQLNVSPPGVNDLNRPMLINTTASRWRELGLASSISRPKYQQRRPRPQQKQQPEPNGGGLGGGGGGGSSIVPTGDVHHPAPESRTTPINDEELLAMSRLLHEAAAASGGGTDDQHQEENKENITIQALPNGNNSYSNIRAVAGLPLGGAKGQIEKGPRRSRSEPMHLPPIDEGQTPPGFRKPATPVYAQNRSRAGMSPGYGDAAPLNANSKRRIDSASRTDSLNGLPNLSRDKNEKNRFVDNSFLRGVQRHTGRMNMNLATMGRPPRVPRHSWDHENSNNNRARSSTDNHPQPPHPNPHAPHGNANRRADVPLRLRDMDLNMFPVHSKMESVRQFHENQFRKHLQQWKHQGSNVQNGTDAAEKHAEAMQLLARYKQRESQTAEQLTENEVGANTNRPQTTGTPHALEQSQNKPPVQKDAPTDSNTNHGRATNQRPKTPSAKARTRTLLPVPPQTPRSNRDNPKRQSMANDAFNGDVLTQQKDQLLLGTPGNTPRLPQAILRVEWNKEVRPTKGAAKPQKDEEYIYKDAKSYIEDNNLLPPDKCRWIQEWVNHVDLTSDCSDDVTSSSYDLTSNCSEELFETDSEDVELDSAG